MGKIGSDLDKKTDITHVSKHHVETLAIRALSNG